jgi:hypothetical protein
MRSDVQCEVQATINENEYEAYIDLRWRGKANKANVSVGHPAVQTETL